MSQGTTLNEVICATPVHDKSTVTVSKEQRPELRLIHGAPCVVVLGSKDAGEKQAREVTCIPLSTVASFKLARDQIET